MTDLLPCPFCGGEAHISVSSDGYGIECANDRCLDMIFDQLPSEAEAIAAWNTRAERTCELTLDGTDGNFGCSECLENIPPLSNYCPNCGARVVNENKPVVEVWQPASADDVTCCVVEI